MKIKLRIRRKYSVFVTIFACALAIWMLVRVFNFPVENLLPFMWIILFLLGTIVALAAGLAFITRWIADRRK